MAEVVYDDHFFARLILSHVIILLQMEKHALKIGWCGMNGLLMDHLYGFMVILDCDVPAIDIGVELF